MPFATASICVGQRQRPTQIPVPATVTNGRRNCIFRELWPCKRRNDVPQDVETRLPGTWVILAANDVPQDVETRLPGTGVILAANGAPQDAELRLPGTGVILVANDAPQDAETRLPGTGSRRW